MPVEAEDDDDDWPGVAGCCGSKKFLGVEEVGNGRRGLLRSRAKVGDDLVFSTVMKKGRLEGKVRPGSIKRVPAIWIAINKRYRVICQVLACWQLELVRAVSGACACARRFIQRPKTGLQNYYPYVCAISVRKQENG